MRATTIGPLNRAETHGELRPGVYLNGRLRVTEDGRVLKHQPAGDNLLMMNGAWYRFVHFHHRMKPHPEVTALFCEVALGPDLRTFFPNSPPPERAMRWITRTPYGDTIHSTEREARADACRWRLGLPTYAWVMVSSVSGEEIAAISG